MSPRFAITDDAAGTFRWVTENREMFEEEMSRTAEFGLSDRFRFIMQSLCEAGIPYVRSDADGGEIRHTVCRIPRVSSTGVPLTSGFTERLL